MKKLIKENLGFILVILWFVIIGIFAYYVAK